VADNEFPTSEYSIEDLEVFMFVNDRGLPSNYGTGFQTHLTVHGNAPMVGSMWTVECNECAPAWSVEAAVPGGQGFDPDIAIIVAQQLNADENFKAAGCFAIYAQLESNVNQYGETSDNLNIFCKDDANITVQVNDQPVQDMTDFTYDGEVQSGAIQFFGDRVAFDSGSSTDFSQPGAASSTVPLSLFAAAVVLVSSALAM